MHVGIPARAGHAGACAGCGRGRHRVRGGAVGAGHQGEDVTGPAARGGRLRCGGRVVVAPASTSSRRRGSMSTTSSSSVPKSRTPSLKVRGRVVARVLCSDLMMILWTYFLIKGVVWEVQNFFALLF
jgi:hypothetical protein